MTGADDSIDPQDLIALTRKYPFVEWGILMSKSSEGGSRFPSANWLRRLVDAFGPTSEAGNIGVNKFCAHLCGRWVRDLMIGDSTPLGIHGHILDSTLFHRVQLNFHASRHQVNDSAFKVLFRIGKQIIFQMDEVNEELMWKARDKAVDAVPLFDTSGGAGIVPKDWPKPFDEVFCGYAGGLGPDNISKELLRIQDAVGDATIWIDMETKIRSSNDQMFDLKKVEECLHAASVHINES